MDMGSDVTSEEMQDEMDGFSTFLGATKEALVQFSHCTLCGANLHFTHITNFTTNLTQETARCPECGIKAHNLIHRLQ